MPGLPRMTPEQLETVRNHEQSGVTSAQLADEWGFARSHICGVARKLGTPFRHRRHVFSEEELAVIKRCVDDGISAVEAMDLLPGRDIETIHKAARSRGWHFKHVYSRQRELMGSGSSRVLFTRGGPSEIWHSQGEEAKRLAADPGVTLREAAQRLGVTRGALIGYLWRQGVIGIMPPPLEDRLPKMPAVTQCMFPLHGDDEPERWCAADVKPGTPYCAPHYARAYVTSEEARRRALAAQELEIARQMLRAEKKREVANATA